MVLDMLEADFILCRASNKPAGIRTAEAKLSNCISDYNSATVFPTTTQQLYFRLQLSNCISDYNSATVFPTTTQQLYFRLQLSNCISDYNSATLFLTSTQQLCFYNSATLFLQLTQQLYFRLQLLNCISDYNSATLFLQLSYSISTTQLDPCKAESSHSDIGATLVILLTGHRAFCVTSQCIF
ncbi:hypothetical protein BaRGS_00007736 [Batillaria attramentaria]|uniref:Uncharacterized protein n=1 Tax=Batillaria attramentaria TaxID=370345 RepID=A0ABD0LNN8_9CAEN